MEVQQKAKNLTAEEMIREQWTEENVANKPFIEFMAKLMASYANPY